MVEQGRLTEEEADDQYSWFQERPDHAVERSMKDRRERRVSNKGASKRARAGGNTGAEGAVKAGLTCRP